MKLFNLLLSLILSLLFSDCGELKFDNLFFPLKVGSNRYNKDIESYKKIIHILGKASDNIRFKKDNIEKEKNFFRKIFFFKKGEGGKNIPFFYITQKESKGLIFFYKGNCGSFFDTLLDFSSLSNSDIMNYDIIYIQYPGYVLNEEEEISAETINRQCEEIASLILEIKKTNNENINNKNFIFSNYNKRENINNFMSTLKEKHKDNPIYIAGFSMGCFFATTLARKVFEKDENKKIINAVFLCCPFKSRRSVGQNYCPFLWIFLDNDLDNYENIKNFTYPVTIFKAKEDKLVNPADADFLGNKENYSKPNEVARNIQCISDNRYTEHDNGFDFFWQQGLKYLEGNIN